MIEYLIPVGESPAKISASEGEQLVCESNRRWEEWTEQTREIRDRALEAMELYHRNRPDEDAYHNPDDAVDGNVRSRVRRPIMGEAIDSVCAQQHLSSFPSEERFFKAKPRNEAAAKKKDVYEKHTEARLSMIDFMVRHYRHRENKMFAGVSCVWHPYMHEQVVETEYQFNTILGIRLPGEMRPVQVEKKKLQFTGFIPLNLEDWRVDPIVDDLKETNLIWRRWLPVEALKKVSGLKNKADITSYRQIWDDSDSNKASAYEYMGITQTWEDTDSLLCEKTLLYEEWGDFYIDDKVFRNHVLLYSNDAVFHGLFPNPYHHQMKPFTVSPYIPRPGTLYGKSLAQDIIPLNHAADTMLNQQIDAFGIVANPSFTYLTRDQALIAYFGDGTVSLRPGEGIPVDDHDSLRPIVFPIDALTISESAQQRIKEEIRESTGGVPYATGGVSEQDTQRTATEVTTLSTGTNTRFQLLIQMDEEQAIKPYLQMVFANDRQFMDEPVFVDDEEEPLTGDDLRLMNLCFDVTGSRSISNRAKEIQEMDSLLAALPGWVQSGFIKLNGDMLIANLPEMLKRRVMLNSSFRDLENVMEIVTVAEQQEMQQPNIGVMPDEAGGLPQATIGGENPNLGGVPALPGVAPPPANGG